MHIQRNLSAHSFTLLRSTSTFVVVVSHEVSGKPVTVEEQAEQRARMH